MGFLGTPLDGMVFENLLKFASSRIIIVIPYPVSSVKRYHFHVYSQYGTWAPWLEDRKKELISTWGLDSDFAEKVAVLLAYGVSEGHAPRIARGWSDPTHQAELRARWDRGDRQGLRVRPAADSKHTVTGFLGSKKALAIDIPTGNDRRMAEIAKALGIGAGITFHDSDPGHFFKL